MDAEGSHCRQGFGGPTTTETLGSMKTNGHPLPQSPSVAALAPGSPESLGPLPPSSSQILTPDNPWGTPAHPIAPLMPNFSQLAPKLIY